jgi:hypothetical protein
MALIAKESQGQGAGMALSVVEGPLTITPPARVRAEID